MMPSDPGQLPDLVLSCFRLAGVDVDIIYVDLLQTLARGLQSCPTCLQVEKWCVALPNLLYLACDLTAFLLHRVRLGVWLVF